MNYKQVVVAGASLFMLGVTACKTKKSVTATDTQVLTQEEKVKEEDFSEFYKKIIDYKTFSGKATVKIEAGKLNQTVTANIKAEKGKQIFISAVAMGIAEVGRLNITPDSLQLINRLDKNYYSLGFKDGVAKLNAPIEFDMVENLFIGNPLIVNEKITNITHTKDLVTISITKGDFTQKLIYNRNTNNLDKQEINSSKEPFTCVINYKDYTGVNNQRFPMYREINLENNGKKMKMEMEFSKAEIDLPVNISFSIPSNYSKKDL